MYVPIKAGKEHDINRPGAVESKNMNFVNPSKMEVTLSEDEIGQFDKLQQCTVFKPMCNEAIKLIYGDSAFKKSQGKILQKCLMYFKDHT